MRKVHVLLYLFLTATLVKAQDLKQVVPPNPDVASLFKSVITPVTEYSGLPNVNIPLYTLQEGGISIPLSLSYATGGIQVSEESGHVGLGWALNAGGAITRNVIGKDDFFPMFGYMSHNRKHPDFPETTLQFDYWRPDIQAFVYSENTPGGQETTCIYKVDGNNVDFNLLPSNPLMDDYDYMPDMFHFNFNGYSGSFVFDSFGQVFLLNKKDIKIEPIGSFSEGFKITTEDGTQYEFAYKAITSFPNGNEDSYTSSWYLSSITDIYGNAATFHYDTPHKLRPFRTFSQSFISDVNSGQQSYAYEEMSGPISETDDIFISSIELKKPDGITVQQAQFEYSPMAGVGVDPDQVRKDMPSKFLKNLKISNSNSDQVQSVDFGYSYFGVDKTFSPNQVSLANGDFAQSIGALGPSYPHLNLRLKLDSITINDIENYAFEYFEDPNMPNKTDMGQDYWGFYNGAINSDIFIPYAYDYGASAQSSIFDQEKKANRIPSEKFAKYFSLKRIHNPTKGWTEFDYELNTYDPDANVAEFPPATQTKSDFAEKAADLENPLNKSDVTTIKINQGSVLKLTYSVTFTGWNTAYNNNQYLNSKPAPPMWQDDFYVEFRDMNNTLLRKFHIPAGNSEWDAMTPQVNQGYSNESVIAYEQTEEWFFDPNANNSLTDDEYQLIAYFDSKDGLYYGQAKIHAQWDDAVVDETKDYSVGGGLRVAAISEYDSDGNPEIRRQFNYHYTETQTDGSIIEKSYGKIKTLPNFTVEKIALRNVAINYNGYPPDWSPVPVANATSHNSFSKDYGSYVGYDQVEVTMTAPEGENGKTIKRFHNNVDLFRPEVPIVGDEQSGKEDSFYKFPPIRLPQNGLLKSETKYRYDNGSYSPVSHVENRYKVNGTPAEMFVLDSLYSNEDRVISAIKEIPIVFVGEIGATNWYCDDMLFHLYPHYSNLIQQTGITEIIYDTEGNNPVTTLQEFKYDSPAHYQRTETKLTNSKGEEVKTRIFYPDDVMDVNSLGSPALLVEERDLLQHLGKNNLHRVAEPVQTETTVNGEKTIQRTSYADWDGDTSVISDRVWPEFVKTLKGDPAATGNTLQERLKYLKYDAFGNPLEVAKEGGASIVYLWGYNHKYPIAKIENAHYDDISASLISAAVSASDLDDDLSRDLMNSLDGTVSTSLDEDTLRNALNDLRNALPGSMVTTYTYDPLVGVTSVTDPRGYTLYYYYDSANRLKEVRDADQNLVTDYEYHYKGQTNN